MWLVKSIQTINQQVSFLTVHVGTTVVLLEPTYCTSGAANPCVPCGSRPPLVTSSGSSLAASKSASTALVNSWHRRTFFAVVKTNGRFVMIKIQGKELAFSKKDYKKTNDIDDPSVIQPFRQVVYECCKNWKEGKKYRNSNSVFAFKHECACQKLRKYNQCIHCSSRDCTCQW